MQIADLHTWQVSPAEAAAIQVQLRQRLSLADGPALGDIRVVVGLDNAYADRAERTTAFAAAVALAFPSLDVITTAMAAAPVEFPYVPGLLAFREAPAALAALRALDCQPDVVICDGHGYAHPRRLGLASHLGLILDRPTIGCAKSRLIGRFEEPGAAFGAWSPLVDRREVVGAVVRTRPGRSPLFVSPGHKLGVDAAVAIILACCRGGARLPEPTRLAHELVTRRARAERSRQSPVASDEQ